MDVFDAGRGQVLTDPLGHQILQRAVSGVPQGGDPDAGYALARCGFAHLGSVRDKMVGWNIRRCSRCRKRRRGDYGIRLG
jgi:hypothetical protein